MSVLRHSRAALGLAALLALLGGCALSAAGQPARTVGLMVAPAGERLAEHEALFADALVGELVAMDLQAVFLHDASPLLSATGASLPAVTATDDWTPLATVLDRLAARLRLDYVALVAIGASGSAEAPKAMLVARGGASASGSCQAPVTHSAEDLAAAVAGRLAALMAEVGEPREADDEPVVAADTGEAAAPAPAADEDTVPPAVPAAETPATDEPPVEGEQTPAAPEAGGEPAGPTDDPLGAARAAYERGDYERAAILLREVANESGPTAQMYLLRARVRVALQLRDEALDDLQRAVALDPELVEARVWLAGMLAERGLWQNAIDHYRQALAVDPMNVSASLGLARVYRDHGHRRKGIALLSDAIRAGQSDPSLLVLLAELHQLEGNFEQAEAALLQVVAVTSGEAQAAALERLGDLYAGAGRNRNALTCYLRAAELSQSRASMVRRRYLDVMAAADNSVHEALTSGWSAFEEYARDGIGEREMVYRRLSEVRAQLQEAMSFADSVRPPEGLRAEHARRQYAYSLAVEATVAALSYLDLGDDAMRERATMRQRDAMAEFNGLRAGPGG